VSREKISFARVSEWTEPGAAPLSSCPRSAAAAADGARPITLPPSPFQALATTLIVTVLPVPAGANASCRSNPLPVNSRTIATCPGLSTTALAATSSSASSTDSALTVRPPVRIDRASNACSAATTLGLVNSCAPAVV